MKKNPPNKSLQAILIADILAVSVLGLLALSWAFQIESVFVGVVFNLAILPSLFFIGFSLIYSLFLLLFRKTKKWLCLFFFTVCLVWHSSFLCKCV